MKIEIIGGGPGGLYLAILTKKARPDWQVAVHEQNREGDTFGFGVVFSDDTLDEFLSRDPQSYAMIRDRFAYWDDIRIVRSRAGGPRLGREVRCGGNGFAGCARLALLDVLHARCRQLGVALHFGEVIDPGALDARFPDADVIVASDGINSRIREHFAAAFRPRVELMANKFTWMGSTRPLTDFTYFFRETPHGIIVAHTYQYEPGRSTWIFETDPACWAAHGFAEMSEGDAARTLEDLFAAELDGHGLVTNRSLWRQFPRVECAAWSHGRIVLLGDAKATAHYSIGSGTKLAMECAIALADALLASPGDVPAAFAAYEAARRTPVEITQHNAGVSLAWFEHVRRSWDMPDMQFANVVMSRAKAITYDNLLLRDPQFVAAVDDEFYAALRAETGFDGARTRPTPMFTPLALRGLTLANRVVVSPMAQYRAEAGVLGDWHLMHYGARALGGAGLVYVEMTCPSPEARITLGCPGLWNDAQEAGLKRLVDFAHGNGGAAVALQLGHAGRKGSTQLGWEKMDHPIAEPAGANWPLVSASPLPWIEGESQVPAELDEAGMAAITADFVAATIRAARAGVDLLELHCAHGYLLASFLSPLTNRRGDAYGGPIENRLRFPLGVFIAIRAAWPADRSMSVRISASDWAEGGVTEADNFAIARAFADAGVDLIDVSTGQTVPHQAPTYGRMYQVPFAEALRNELGVRTMCVGAITEPGQVNTIIACRRADLVAIGRPHLTDPNWSLRAAAWYANRAVAVPPPWRAGAAQLFRETEKTREKQAELQQKAKPRRHHTEATLALRTAAE